MSKKDDQEKSESMKHFFYFSILLFFTNSCILEAAEDIFNDAESNSSLEETCSNIDEYITDNDDSSSSLEETGSNIDENLAESDDSSNEALSKKDGKNIDDAISDDNDSKNCPLQMIKPLAACSDLKFSSNQYFLSLRRNQGRSIFSRSSYTTLEAFSFPFQYKNAHPFFDLRFHRFDDSENAVNVGLGCRFNSPCCERIYGVNMFYDYRRACNSDFNQFGLGFEILGEIWNFRLNGYLPVGNKSQRCSFCFFDGYIGDFFFLEEKFMDSLKGINFEIEAIARDCCGNGLGLAIGPYYYNRRKGCRRDIYGSELRLSSWFCNYFTFVVLASYDNVFKGRIQAQLGLTVPLYFQQSKTGSLHIGCCNQRLFQPIQRNDAVLIKSHRRWKWNF